MKKDLKIVEPYDNGVCWSFECKCTHPNHDCNTCPIEIGYWKQCEEDEKRKEERKG